MTKKTSQTASHTPALFIGVLVAALPTGNTHNEIQLLPAGEFRARDGRPAECATWVLTDAQAAQLVAAANARQTPYVIDYDHQTLRAVANGKPAPAAGWFKTLEWRGEAGLWAVDVEWTAAAARHIQADEYKFISPVFLYDKNGKVTEMVMAAITNNPAVDGMSDVMLAAASHLAGLSTLHPATSTTTQESDMDELIERLRWMLNLPITATAEDIQAELKKLIEQIGGDMAAASFDLRAHLQARSEQVVQKIAALTATQADPAKYVPVATMQALQAEIAALRSTSAASEVDTLVQTALSDGRLLPAQENWARELAAANPLALRGYLDTAPRVAALTNTQVKPGDKRTSQAPALDDINLAVCAAFGNDPADVQQYLTQE